MNRPDEFDTDFESQVRLALGEHAGEAPHVDLADGALSKARGLRRRRVAASAVAAVVTVAVAVPIGAEFLNQDASTDHTASRTTDTGPLLTPTPKPVRVDISKLPEAGAPNVSYIDGSTFVDSSGTTHPAQAGSDKIVTDAATLADGTLLWEQDATTPVTTYKVAGGGTSDLPQAQSVTTPAIDQDTKAAVFALHDANASGQPAKTDTLVYAKALHGTATTVDTGMHVRQVMGAYQGNVVFNATIAHGKREVVGVVTMSGAGSSVTTPFDDLKTVTAVSPTEALIAGVPTKRAATYAGQQRCSLVLNSRSLATVWMNCDWNPVEFSPDGTRVLAQPYNADGLGPTTLAVLDAQTGDVVREYRTAGTFGRATFDGDSNSIVAVVAEGDQASIVRCSIDSSDCELAAPLATVVPDEPHSLLQPYQLTAN